MIMPRMPRKPADLYTVRIFDATARPSLLRTLKSTVSSSGGTLIIDLVEGRGFIFSMPRNTPDPLASYQYARWMEEGCIHVSKMMLEKEDLTARPHEPERWPEEGSEGEDSTEGDGDVDEHPNLKLKWTWTELRR